MTGGTAAEIAASLEGGVHAGRVGPGDPLPTVRELAATLRVSPATVAAAYKLLKARGFIVGRGRRGTRVASRAPTPIVAAPSELPAGTVDLATGNPDPALLPPLEPALLAVDASPLLYGAGPHHRDLIAFASGELQADGIPTGAITVLSGALDAVDRVLREHLRPGDRVALEDPSFPAIVDLVNGSGYAVVPFGLDDDGPRPEEMAQALGKGCRALIVTPRAQNPTGAAISAGRAVELQRLLRRFPDVVLIENDYASPIAGAPLRTLCGASRAAWCAVRSTSKFLGPDLRVALMAGDALTIARVQGRQALGARWVSHILQQLAVALWSDPSSGRRLARAAETYAGRRAALLTALEARGVRAHGRSGLNVWVPVREEASAVRRLADRGWAVAAGERFRIRSAPAIRVTISTLSPSDARRFADDLADALRSAATGFA
jgi:DNA-binding transcriptional MocR family regulator